MKRSSVFDSYPLLSLPNDIKKRQMSKYLFCGRFFIISGPTFDVCSWSSSPMRFTLFWQTKKWIKFQNEFFLNIKEDIEEAIFLGFFGFFFNCYLCFYLFLFDRVYSNFFFICGVKVVFCVFAFKLFVFTFYALISFQKLSFYDQKIVSCTFNTRII